jgi:hypothetical protein
VQRPLPPGSTAGNKLGPEDVPVRPPCPLFLLSHEVKRADQLLLFLQGALGLGLPSASAITKTFQFLSYTLPILGGIMAE